ncbi:MAG: methyl-accepting chemotaxis protein [Burkholderiales bacterium]|nr:methyl-accepting chemotaxis protein [Burkholderiales bacterium]
MTVTSLRLTRWMDSLAWWVALREFFAYHGVWAIGVRLLRVMTVRGKVLLVMGITAAPLLPLTWYVAAQQNQIVGSTRLQLAAVRLGGAAVNLDVELGAQALALDGGKPADAAALARPWAELKSSYEQARAAGLPIQPAWERSHPALEAALQAGTRSELLRAQSYDLAEAAVAEFHLAVLEEAADTALGDHDLSQSASLALRDLPTLLGALGRLRPRADPKADPASSALVSHANQLAAAATLSDVRRLAAVVEGRLRSMHHDRAGAREMLPAVASAVDLAQGQLLALDAHPDLARLQPALAAARQEVQRLQQLQQLEVETALAQRLVEIRELRLRIFGALFVSLALASYLLYTFFLVMRGGLVQLNHQMTRMSQGDLSARLNPHGVDEVAATMRAMTTSLTRLSDLLAAVRNGVSAVNHASQQVAAGNADLSNRNHATAQGLTTAVEGVARASSQLEACGRQVERVVGSVQALRLEAARNRKQMQRLRERMTSLRTKSREIGEIVTLIDNIAFRTNILALNASVEAGKAGEAGRGFAVVAQEVRSLALRGAESARRIGDIVIRSTDDIELSSALAEETGRAMASSDGHVDQIHVAMDDVAALTRNGVLESAAILEQLTTISEGTTQNLRLVEQLAAASEGLRSQGERLAHKVGQFQLS